MPYSSGPRHVLNRSVLLLVIILFLPQSIFAARIDPQVLHKQSPVNGFQTSAAQPQRIASPGIERIGHSLGSVIDIEVEGTIAYIADYSREIAVFDLADPAQPVMIGSLPLLAQVRSLQLVGSTLYALAGDTELYLIDVTNSQAPTLVGTYSAASLITDVHVVGTLAYLTVRDQGLYIIDVSNRSSPILRGQLAIQVPGTVHVAGNRAYVGDFRWVRIVDVSDPLNPALLGSYDTEHFVADIAVADDNAYVLLQGGNTEIIRVLDVSIPANPTLRSSYQPGPPFGAGGTEIQLVGNRAYVSARFSGFLILDTSNPANLGFLGAYNIGFVGAFDVQNTTAYLVHSSGTQATQIVDVSNPGSTVVLGSVPTVGSIGDIAVRDNRAYVVSEDGLKIFDTTSPAMPTLLSSPLSVPALSGKADTIELVDDLAYTISCIGGDFANSSNLRLFDVSDAVNPSALSSLTYSTPGCATDLAVVGTTAYLTDRAQGLKVFNVTDPVSPTLVQNIATPGTAEGIHVVGSMAYIADGLSGLLIFNISNPVAPTLVGQFDTPGDAQDVYAVGTHAYVADSFNGLHVIDVSMPQSPTLLRTFTTLGWAVDVQVVGTLAYVNEGSALEVIDISDTTGAPRRGSYSIGGNVSVVDNIVYLAAGRAGIHILRITPEELVSYTHSLYLPVVAR